LTEQFTIVNVATASLDQPVDLEHLRKQFPKHILWDQDIYGGRVAYYKTEKMEGKVSIFWSGKLISVGTKTIEKAFQELYQIISKLQEDRAIHVIYEPEQFPAAIIKLPI